MNFDSLETIKNYNANIHRIADSIAINTLPLDILIPNQFLLGSSDSRFMIIENPPRHKAAAMLVLDA